MIRGIGLAPGLRMVRLAVISLLALGCLIFSDLNAQTTATSNASEGRQISLSDQLRSGLRAFTKNDLAFLDNVVLKVNQGKLPRKLVDGTFHWARGRAERKSWSRSLRPIVYFRPALTERAKRIGVKL